MKQTSLSSIAIAIVIAVFVSNVWAGSQTVYINPTIQGIFPTNSLILESPTFCKTLTGPASSALDSVVVSGTFSANCPVSVRTMQILDGSLNVIGSNTFPNGSFKVKIAIPKGYPANGTYCVRFVAQRALLTNPCAASINSGTGTIIYYYTP